MCMNKSQRINPIEGSTVSIQSSKSDGDGNRLTHQTGYKRHGIGMILYALTMLTFFGWFVLQVLCTLLYLQGNYPLMALRTFNACWMAGFIWNCSLLRPHSIESLFLRRCLLAEATHVAIFQETSYNNDTTCCSSSRSNREDSFRVSLFLKIVLRQIEALAHNYFTLLFADPHCRPNLSKGIFRYCPVLRNDDDKSGYLVFSFRRYNFSHDRQVFLVGSWSMAKSFRKLVPPGISTMDETQAKYHPIMMMDDIIISPPDNSNHGILGMMQSRPTTIPKYHLDSKGQSTEEVAERFRAVGPNVLSMESPNYFRIFMSEIANSFYIYRVYIVWVWVALDYLYATLTFWMIVLLTASIVAWFRFRGAKVLFALSHSSGNASVLRNGVFVLVTQANLVPGDIVKVAPGVVHCDMLLLTGETVVDESALTGEATPQPKSPVDPHSDEEYDSTLHKKQTISAGTHVIECENEALALVTKTGSNTTKGEMMRDVLLFRTHHLEFQSELPVVFSVLLAYSTIFLLVVLFGSSDTWIVAWFLAL
jgi:hypothetical protein